MFNKIIFDLDRTLFNTQLLLDNCEDRNLFKNGFNLDFIDTVCWQKIKSKLAYDDVVSFLDLCRDKKISTYIFSQGNYDGQWFKLEISGLINHFLKENIFIFDDKVRQLDNLRDLFLKDAIYIDDREDYLLKAKQIYPNLTIALIIRDNSQVFIKNSLIDYQVNSLNKIINLL